MGGTAFNSTDYSAGVSRLRSTGKAFARASSATAKGAYDDIAEILDPKKLKNSMREACFAAGFNDSTPIIVSLDCTGSMSNVPKEIQGELPKLIDLLIEQGISDHPNLMFMAHDDETVVKNAAFQMSQFETGADELVKSLNEMIIPGNGGGNDGEGYHLSCYAAARHTRLECHERDGTKGFMIYICDEQPYYDAADPATHGTTPEIAMSVFGDRLQETVTMLDSMKEVCKRYHVFVIRPGHTSHGKNHKITKMWQELLSNAGENPEHVLEIEETSAIISTIALAIGRLCGADSDEMVDVLKTKNAIGVDAAAAATKAIVPANNGKPLATSTADTNVITTTDGKPKPGRPRKMAAAN